ncbi:hypothetical protein JAK58_17685 [Stenotrophomonas maltophilia]|uniref:hypothetical protein n=1 Tax=Stenotrophomonas maltophilia TaxID=40324 RepID=UPI0021C871C0|nr:hypothetical protein [Stenotrophomonas maltophilia]MCU1093343.1 hypothetical protein [Stenotrophomonas maltophilia]
MIDVVNSNVSSPIQKLHELQVIIKIAERCNLACSYCYYFFMGDDSYKDRDPIMKPGKFSAVADYIKRGVEDRRIHCLN